METTRLDTDVTNALDDAGVEDAQLFKTDYAVKVVFGYLNNGNPVSAQCQHFAALSIDREANDYEQEQFGDERINFSSVLLAGKDGEAEQEQLINVDGGDVADAIAAFEEYASETVDMEELGTTVFSADNGTVEPISGPLAPTAENPSEGVGDSSDETHTETTHSMSSEGENNERK